MSVNFEDANRKEIHYDAFISYRHVKRDAMVAEKLHKKLERYRIPRKIAKATGHKRLSRVFRDQEELSLSGVLTDNIYRVLRNSEYLIVICSPESLHSEWVQKEVEYFIECHNPKNVLAVLVKGETDEAFPQVLLENEPRAADVRGDTDKEILKKLDSEFLRLMAAMLYCEYDDLRQRHREYALKRIILALCTVLFLALIFTVYASHQAAEIRSKYRDLQRNRARNLAKEAEILMNKGDRIGCLKNLLEVTPEKDNAAEPVAPEQMYGLNRALNSYYHSGSFCSLQPVVTRKLDTIAAEVGSFSLGGNLFFSLDMAGTAYFFNASDGKLIWRITAGEVDNQRREVFIDGLFLNDEEVLLMTERNFYLLNVEKRECEQIIKSGYNGEYRKGNPVAYNGRFLAVGYPYDKHVYIYELKNRMLFELQSIELAMLPSFDHRISCIAFAPGQQLIAVGMTSVDESVSQAAITILDLKGKIVFQIASPNVRDIKFIDNKQIAVIQYDDDTDGEASNFYRKEYHASIYDLKRKSVIWESEHYTPITFWNDPCVGIEYMEEFIHNNKSTEAIFFYIANKVIVLEKNNYKVIGEVDFDDFIIGVSKINSTNLVIGLYNGSVYRYWSDAYSMLFSINNDVGKLYVSPSQRIMVQIGKYSEHLIFSGIIEDAAMVCVGENKPKIDSIRHGEIVESSGEKLAARFEEPYIKIINTVSGKCLMRVEAKRICAPLFGFFGNDQQLIVYYDEIRMVEIWDLKTRGRLVSQNVNIGRIYKTELIIDPKGEFFAVNSDKSVYCVDDMHGWYSPELVVFYVDDEMQIYPYAVVPYGEVDFKKRNIYCRSLSDGVYYKSPFYTFAELKNRAEVLIDEFT